MGVVGGGFSLFQAFAIEALDVESFFFSKMGDFYHNDIYVLKKVYGSGGLEEPSMLRKTFLVHVNLGHLYNYK